MVTTTEPQTYDHDQAYDPIAQCRSQLLHRILTSLLAFFYYIKRVQCRHVYFSKALEAPLLLRELAKA